MFTDENSDEDDGEWFTPQSDYDEQRILQVAARRREKDRINDARRSQVIAKKKPVSTPASPSDAGFTASQATVKLTSTRCSKRGE
jgi:hypothetical protein